MLSYRTVLALVLSPNRILKEIITLNYYKRRRGLRETSLMSS